jgi:very-short-patch-repair endonuclease
VPLTNTKVAGWEVDAFWPRHKLIVEVDGFAYHGSRAAFERDRRKDAALTQAGYRVLRVTWRRLVHEPHAVVALLARLLPP